MNFINFGFCCIHLQIYWDYDYMLDAWGWCTGMTQREEGLGWGTCVYLWQIHVDIWQNQYNIVKLKKIIIFK